MVCYRDTGLPWRKRGFSSSPPQRSQYHNKGSQMSLCLPSAYKSYVHTTLKSGNGARELCLKKQCASSKNTLLPKNASRHLGFWRVTTTDQHNKYNCSEEVWWELLKSYWEKKMTKKLAEMTKMRYRDTKWANVIGKVMPKICFMQGLLQTFRWGWGVGREAVSGKESKVKGNKMRCTAHRNMSLRLINIFISSHSCLFVFCGESARNLSKFQYAIKSFISFYF